MLLMSLELLVDEQDVDTELDRGGTAETKTSP